MKSAETSEQKETELDSFRREIQKEKDKNSELKTQGKSYNPHYEKIDPEDLIERDMEMYHKFKDGLIGKFSQFKDAQDFFKEFTQYRNEVFRDLEEKSRPEDTEEDQRMYQKLKNDEITAKDYLKYRQKRIELAQMPSLLETEHSRSNFCALIEDEISNSPVLLEKLSRE